MGTSRGGWWRRQAPSWSVWKALGVIAATLLAIGGLVFVGYFVLMFIALSQWGSNK
jgi:hypothetical protein